MGRQQDVGRVFVPEMQQRARKTLRRVVDARDVGMSRTLDHGGERGRGSTRRPLLEIAPQVGLDLDDHLAAERRGLLHQQHEVAVVGIHGARVVEVAEVAVAFV